MSHDTTMLGTVSVHNMPDVSLTYIPWLDFLKYAEKNILNKSIAINVVTYSVLYTYSVCLSEILIFLEPTEAI